MTKSRLILASASIGRKGLLERLGVPFEVIVSDIDEDKILHQNPYKMIQMRAQAKTEDVVKKLTAHSQQLTTKDSQRAENWKLLAESYLIIAADSMAVLGNETYGKAKDQKDAARIVRELMGKTHTFTTATTIIHVQIPPLLERGGQEGLYTELNRWESLTKTLVTCRTMSESEIEAYTTRYDFTKLAAAYALDRTPWDWITKIEGSFTNVVGLPFEVILPIFRSFKLIQ